MPELNLKEIATMSTTLSLYLAHLEEDLKRAEKEFGPHATHLIRGEIHSTRGRLQELAMMKSLIELKAAKEAPDKLPEVSP